MKTTAAARKCGLTPGVAACAIAALWLAPGNQAKAQVKATLLYSFKGGATDGANPGAMMLGEQSGNPAKVKALYSTTQNGGAAGGGVAWKLSPPTHGTVWKEKVLTVFGTNGEGSTPGDGALSAKTAKISVTTPLYGALKNGGANGEGQIYSVTGRTFTKIWDFTGGSDGGAPVDLNVVAAPTGVLFATTTADGGKSGCGTVDELVPPAPGATDWTENTIWTFNGAPDGCVSMELIEDANGALYGTTFSGGKYGHGTVFQLTPPSGGGTVWTEQVLWSFKGGSDADQPDQLSFGAGGVLYGTSYFGGGGGSCENGCGTVFQLTPPAQGKTAWTEQVLWSFTGGADGNGPFAGMLADQTGALYSTVSRGAASNDGVVYKLTPPAKGRSAWTETTLYTFDNTVGAVPNGGLVADGNGVLYGTTVYGGASGNGAVFSLSGTGFVP